jgi:hypothetical protein
MDRSRTSEPRSGQVVGGIAAQVVGIFVGWLAECLESPVFTGSSRGTILRQPPLDYSDCVKAIEGRQARRPAVTKGRPPRAIRRRYLSQSSRPSAKLKSEPHTMALVARQAGSGAVRAPL